MHLPNLQSYIDQFWDRSILPTLMEYIKIPNKSPHFDQNWLANGYMLKATQLIAQWCQTHALPNMTVEVMQLEQRTPLIFIELPGDANNTILLYGHLDKQPEMVGWQTGLHPFQPVLRGEKLYGRGAADDGYAAFASLAAIKALHETNIKHPRCVLLIEACEESGSYDLPHYVNALKLRIGTPNLVICLDSGCGNYEQLWLTTSLRGLVTGTIDIDILQEGIHSGAASGVVPGCFRILNQLLQRVEDNATGNILLNALQVDIPADRSEQAKKTAQILGQHFYDEFPFVIGAKAETTNIAELLLRRTWYPALSLVGCDGLPNIANAGNVTIPKLSVKFSMRLPPTCDPEVAAYTLQNVWTQEPPYNAKINVTITQSARGWNAPVEAAWLRNATDEASQIYFEKDAAYLGEGGTIPFMGMLGGLFPNAQFLITGVLGPASNAHGPNEFLHIPMAKKLTACIAHVIGASLRPKA